MSMTKLIELSRCRLDTGTFVECSGRELAVFNLANPTRLFVIDNTCPHAGGNLSGGDIEGDTVSCRWHQWVFDLNTGAGTHSPLARVGRYDCEVRDGFVWVDLPD